MSEMKCNVDQNIIKMNYHDGSRDNAHALVTNFIESKSVMFLAVQVSISFKIP